MLPTGLSRALADAGYAPDTRSPRPAAGGSISRAWTLRTRDGVNLFLKTGPAEAADAFEAERDALAALAATATLRVPRPLAAGCTSDTAWLLLEFVDLDGPRARAAPALGEGLARLHRVQWEQFGWQRDNVIGRTPQANTPCGDWAGFWRERRLRPMLRHAEADGHGALAERGQRLLERLETFFRGYDPVPSLLHGDLWSGNWGATPAGEPVIFDPATYYGDRETDLAMTELFGGFGRAFQASYRSAWPLDAGYPVRRDLYNLYHVLNHLHLFGGAWLAQAETMLDRLLAEA